MRVAACAAVAGTLASCQALPDPAPVPAVAVSRTHCGEGWTAPHPGAQVFHLRNTGNLAATARLVDPRTGVVFGEVDQLGPGAERDLSVVLGGGRYAFRCLPEAHDPVTGPTVQVAGPVVRMPSALPVSENDLLEPLRRYREYVRGGLDGLVTDTERLRSAVRAGSPQARDWWLTAHLDYERLGAAYGAFGDFDEAINGEDTGFHRLERGLWSGADPRELGPVADRLAEDVAALRADFEQQRIDPLDLGLRAHEILENTLQFELTGRNDQGSGSTLATARANLDGTYAVLDVLRPLLVGRYPELPATDAALQRVRDELDRHRGTPLDALPRRDRQRLNGFVGEALERLAPIAALCEPRRTP